MKRKEKKGKNIKKPHSINTSFQKYRNANNINVESPLIKFGS